MKRSLLSSFSLMLLVLFCAERSNAQLSTASFISVKDSYTRTQSAYTNYGSSTIMNPGTFVFSGRKGLVYHHNRAFLEFDISSIPQNAIIHNAFFTVRRSGTLYGSQNWAVRLIESTWSESTIKAIDQPQITTNSNYTIIQAPSGATSETFYVTDMVQKMVYGSLQNYGWTIQVENEMLTSLSGCNFFTREYNVSSYRPRLTVQYYLPLAVENVQVAHETGMSNSDGSISFSLTGGASSTFSYQWENASGTMSGQTSSSLSNLEPGWYGVHVTGNEYGEELYQGFLVGRDCDEVTISYQSDGNYASNALANDLVLGGVDYGDYHFTSQNQLTTEAWQYSTGNYGDVRSWMKFNLWMDDKFSINQADLQLNGMVNGHYQDGTVGGANSARFNILTEAWNEDLITANSAPTQSLSTTQLIPSTSFPGYSTEDNTVDISAFWEVWKSNNASNHGVVFELQNFANTGNRRQRYDPPHASTASNAPVIEFKLDLRGRCTYYLLKPEVEQTIAYVRFGKLRFRFEEDYFDTTGDLSYKLLNLNDDNTHTGLISKNTGINWFELEDGVGGVSFNSGDVYLLEVINTKAQKSYLKFKVE